MAPFTLSQCRIGMQSQSTGCQFRNVSRTALDIASWRMLQQINPHSQRIGATMFETLITIHAVLTACWLGWLIHDRI